MEEGRVRLRVHNGEKEDISEIQLPKERRYLKYHAEITMPTYVAFVVILTGVFFYGLAYILHYRLPTPLSISDIKANPDKFIAERALHHLRQLTNLGSKPVGSYENEVLAVDFLTREIGYIMQRANPVHKISFDIQKVTGSYNLGFKPHGLTNYYSQVQNIVVKLGGNSSSSLLVNCHFDSVPTSPGGSDDGLNCAVMLEVLEVLSHFKKALKHNVVFLFNGAEESPLQASHGFITQHKWANEVKAFINLEACGAGGREVLFQAGPNHPWLLQMYADSVPHPHAQVIAEDIFQSGLVPSDTDFRIFRDFGKIPGVDFAHAMNGYVYHTSYDNLHAIPTGTIQHTGDNLLALVSQIASSDILSNPEEYAEGRTIFFDVVGIFFINYSELTGILINVATVVLSLYAVITNINIVRPGHPPSEFLKLLLLSFGVPALGWFLAFISVIITAVVLDLFNASMSWFSRSFLIFCLYYCPVLISSMVFPVVCNMYKDKKNLLSSGMQGRLYVNGVQFLWTILLLGGTIAGIRSAFMFMLVLLFPVLGSIIVSLSRWKYNDKLWFTVYIINTLPFTFFIMYHTVMALGLFVPITGRMGSERNPDIIIGILAALLCILSFSFVSQLIVLLKSPWRVLSALSGFHLITILAVLVTPLGFPYSGNPSSPSPQRIHVYHTERTFHDALGHVRYQDSGYWLMNLDRHSPSSVSSLIPELAKMQSVSSFCENELVCGLPLFSSRILQIIESTHWIPASSSPVVHHPTNVELLSDDEISDRVRRLNFSVVGPDHMTVVLSSSFTILNWSFDPEVVSTGDEWQNKPIYYINYAQGLTGSPFKFWIDLEVTEETETTVLDIAVIGHYINNHGDISEDFSKFLKKYPDWTHVTAWPVTYKSWKF